MSERHGSEYAMTVGHLYLFLTSLFLLPVFKTHGMAFRHPEKLKDVIGKRNA